MREYPRSWQEFQDILHWVANFCIQDILVYEIFGFELCHFKQ